MLASVPRWFIYSLVLVAVVTVLILLRVERTELPEDCLRANTAMEAGDFDAAIENYFLCIETGELSEAMLANAYYFLGQAYFAKGDYYQAVKDYGSAIELNPDHAWAYNNRCWAYGLLRRADEALSDCNEALRLLPDRPAILDSRALAYWQLREFNKAQADLDRARQIDSSMPTPEERFREFEEMF